MILPTWLVLLLGVICYFILPVAIWLIKKEKLKNIFTIIFFCLYLGVLFCGVFGKLGIDGNKVVINFDFGGRWCAKTIKWSLLNISTFDLVINLVMLLPVGMFILYFSQKKKWWVRLILLIFLGFASGALIETCQFILPIQRSVQLSDAILNMVSVFIGGLIAWGYLSVINKIRNKRNA
ncbi:MAG: VanZ family protein [Clostridia bacterium]|nr:VanZ family protein [Clostridia bacterium]